MTKKTKSTQQPPDIQMAKNTDIMITAGIKHKYIYIYIHLSLRR